MKCGHEGYPMERSLRSCSVLEVIGSHCPQYFRLVILKYNTQEKHLKKNMQLSLDTQSIAV